MAAVDVDLAGYPRWLRPASCQARIVLFQCWRGRHRWQSAQSQRRRSLALRLVPGVTCREITPRPDQSSNAPTSASAAQTLTRHPPAHAPVRAPGWHY
jgi:hypothetical protein